MACYYACVILCLFLMMVQRGAGDDSQFYVSSNRLGCEMVHSVHPCPATQLNPELAIDYETDADMVNLTLDDASAANASQECILALRKTYCSVFTPRCFVNGSRDYGDARMDCWKANRTCPLDIFKEGLCESLQVGLQPLGACVKPSKPIKGSCPQPKLKMPQDKLDLYIRSSIEYEYVDYFKNLTTARFPNGTRMFSDYCIAKIPELYCLPFYCSADEKQIIVEYTLEGCEDIVDRCFYSVIDEIQDDQLREDIEELHDEYIGNCVFYPDPERPTSMSSGDPPGDLTTPPYQNVSSPKNVSTTPQSRIPSTTPPENATATTSQQESPSTTPLENATATTSQQESPSTTPLENATFTTPGQNMSSPPETATPEAGGTEKPTLYRKTELLQTPTPTAGNDRCQTFSSFLLLLILLAVFI